MDSGYTSIVPNTRLLNWLRRLGIEPGTFVSRKWLPEAKTARRIDILKLISCVHNALQAYHLPLSFTSVGRGQILCHESTSVHNSIHLPLDVLDAAKMMPRRSHHICCYVICHALMLQVCGAEPAICIPPVGAESYNTRTLCAHVRARSPVAEASEQHHARRASNGLSILLH